MDKLGNITLYNADCMDIMRDIPDKSFDLAIVDPPYGIGASRPSKKPKTVRQKNGSILRVESCDYGQKDWDDVTPCDSYFDELFRVSKNQIVWGVNYYQYPMPGGRIVWDKLNGESDQFDCEIAYNSFNRRTDIVYFMWCGVLQGVYCGKDIRKALVQQGNKALNEHRIHPTQKPVALYKWLLSHYAKPGDKILDTHLGSGSICIACHDLGFEMTGIELDKDYYEAAKKRIMDYQLQQKLF